jgi:hypothetical protein
VHLFLTYIPTTTFCLWLEDSSQLFA